VGTILFQFQSLGSSPQIWDCVPDIQPVANISSRQRLQSSSTSASDVESTWLSTACDRAFHVAAARTWNSLPAMLRCSECTGGRIFSKCKGHPRCLAKCRRPNPKCPKVCRSGCTCPPTAPFWHVNSCYTADQCKGTPNTIVSNRQIFRKTLLSL